jgi:hypothetical protein
MVTEHERIPSNGTVPYSHWMPSSGGGAGIRHSTAAVTLASQSTNRD